MYQAESDHVKQTACSISIPLVLLVKKE